MLLRAFGQPPQSSCCSAKTAARVPRALGKGKAGLFTGGTRNPLRIMLRLPRQEMEILYRCAGLRRLDTSGSLPVSKIRPSAVLAPAQRLPISPEQIFAFYLPAMGPIRERGVAVFGRGGNRHHKGWWRIGVMNMEKP